MLKKHLQPARSSLSSRQVTLSQSLTKSSRVLRSVSSSTLVLFRAYRLMDAVRILISMATVHNFEIFTDGSLFARGIDAFNFALLGVYALVMLAVDVCKYKQIKVRSVIEKQHWLCQVAVVVLGVLAVLLLGVYGPGFEASNFIYSQF